MRSLFKGDFLNCDADEIVFGHNTTTLIYHLAHSIFDQSPTMSSIGDQEESTALPWVTSGTSNIVLSTMEHDANAGPWERLANNIGCEVSLCLCFPYMFILLLVIDKFSSVFLYFSLFFFSLFFFSPFFERFVGYHLRRKVD
jgi:hypothetical protein